MVGLDAGGLGGGADDAELGDRRGAVGVDEREPRRLRQVGAGGADVRVGLAQRRDQLGQDRRVGGVELLAHAREVDRRAQALEEDVGVADAGGRVGVELEELDVVALQEGVEPADAHRAREARVDADQRVLGVGELELVAECARRSGRRRRSGRARWHRTVTACLTRRTWPGETKCGISTNGIVCPANTTSCSLQPARRPRSRGRRRCRRAWRARRGTGA